MIRKKRVRSIRTKETIVRVTSKKGERDVVEVRTHSQATLKISVWDKKIEKLKEPPKVDWTELFKQFEKRTLLYSQRT